MINFKVELIKLLSCMDAVFKLLHVEIARKATDGSEKKKNLMQNLGYYQFKHKARRAGWGWAQAALGARHGTGAQGSGAHGRDNMRGALAARRPGRDLGMLLGQQAVHSVHSACFGPVSTQYCS